MEVPISASFEPATRLIYFISTTCFKGSEQFLSILLPHNIHNIIDIPSQSSVFPGWKLFVYLIIPSAFEEAIAHIW